MIKGRGSIMPNDENKLDDDLLDLLEDDVLYEDEEEDSGEKKNSEPTEQQNKKEEKLEKRLEGKSEYLKKIFKGEKTELVNKVIESMKMWENPPVKKDKSKYRERLAQNFWAFYRDVAPKAVKKSLAEPKRKMLRYGLLDPDYISEGQKKLIDKMDKENMQGDYDSIFLADEWFRGIAKGDIQQSVLDETALKKKGPTKDKLDSKKGQLEAEIKSAKLKIDKILELEEDMTDLLSRIKEHNQHPDFDDVDIIDSYESNQREALTNLIESGRNLLRVDKQLESNFKTIDKIRHGLNRLEEAYEGEENDEEVQEMIFNEFLSFRQMVKMCAGRQGNHFPILFKSYFAEDVSNIATKKNIEKIISDVEKLDPSLFVRTYKGEEHRIYPYVLIVPSYGNKGICWEPFSRSNRATSKGRLIIPMFPKNLKASVLAALADIRWQVAKEKAQHYWMEEGLTGYYYEYYMKEKLKGNIKNHFINDYLLWIAWEAKGVQRLHKDVRPVFWRYTPFPEKIKESLKNRGFYYRELYKKDQNRSMSDGY